MLRPSRHQVIVNAKRRGFGEPSREWKQRIQRSTTRNVHVHIDASIMPEHKVLQRVDALDWVLVSVVGWQEPRVMFFKKFSPRRRVPYLDCVLGIERLAVGWSVRADRRDVRESRASFVEVL